MLLVMTTKTHKRRELINILLIELAKRLTSCEVQNISNKAVTFTTAKIDKAKTARCIHTDTLQSPTPTTNPPPATKHVYSI